jgi:acyl-coenzyme A thioesterase PaaI-like protein
MSSYAKWSPQRFLKNPSAKSFMRMARFFPPIRRTGVRIKRLSDDWLEWDVELPLTWRTRNYVGTHFGGSLYSSADPFLMLSFMHLVDAIVWDKAAAVRFKRPGRGKLFMQVRINLVEVLSIQDELKTTAKFDRTYTLYWKDIDGNIVAEVDKIIHFRARQPS